MHYLGSKARHAKEIIAITTANRRDDQIYVEPFVGGGNVINKVPQGAGRMANDKNYGMTALLHALGNLDWTPPETMTQTEWKRIMKKAKVLASLPLLEQAEFAFAATGPTFGSMWCGQWAKDDADKPAGTRYRQARDAALRDAPGLKGIQFTSGDFNGPQLVIPERALVYCDPPYVNTTGYSGAVVTIKADDKTASNTWNASKFWKWADALVDRGCDVYVSEYTGPAPSAYTPVPTPEQAAELAAARAERKGMDPNDTTISSERFEESNRRILAAEDAIRASCVTLAARWKVMWEKEVISDFSASRGKEAEGTGGKRETEKLFHRSA